MTMLTLFQVTAGCQNSELTTQKSEVRILLGSLNLYFFKLSLTRDNRDVSRLFLIIKILILNN